MNNFLTNFLKILQNPWKASKEPKVYPITYLRSRSLKTPSLKNFTLSIEIFCSAVMLQGSEKNTIKVSLGIIESCFSVKLKIKKIKTQNKEIRCSQRSTLKEKKKGKKPVLRLLKF